ncbi:GNAT family N-acetyltransferase [Kitasatospora sp. NPDC097643]|uniref:GNAT family N-acetyltransferase n=1 Tax=Kitasatospora sp. NPDC097643 TaxID=3157230 RepID=UPI003331936C
MLSLKILAPDDWPLWRELRLAALTDAPHAFKAGLAGWHHGGEERWRARLHLPGSHQVAALLHEPGGVGAVGLAGGVPGADGVRELRSVWVGPKARGRGVADRLIEEVERWARASGGTTLRLAVLPGNEPALALYRRHGFVPLTEPGEPLRAATARELVMAKPLR